MSVTDANVGVFCMTLFSWILLALSFLLSFGLLAAMEEIKNLLKKIQVMLAFFVAKFSNSDFPKTIANRGQE